MSVADPYRRFLEAKTAVAPPAGFDIDPAAIHPLLKPHQRAMVQWAVKGGRRAVFIQPWATPSARYGPAARLLAESSAEEKPWATR